MTALGSTPLPLVLDVDNVVSATVVNRASTPTTPVGTFTVTDAAGTTLTIPGTQPVPDGTPLLPGQERVFNATLQGRDSAGAPLRAGGMTVRFVVDDGLGGIAQRVLQTAFEWRGVDLVVDDRSSAQLAPQEPWGHLTATVTSRASATFPVRLELRAPDGDWKGWVYSFRPDRAEAVLEFTGAQAPAPGTSQQAFIYITAPVTARPGTATDQGPALLAARSGPGPERVLDLHARSPHAVSGGRLAFEVLESPTAAVQPGTAAQFHVAVHNLRNTDEVGYLRLQGPVGVAVAAGLTPASNEAETQGMSPGDVQEYAVSIPVPAALADAGARAGRMSWSATFVSTRAGVAETRFAGPLAFDVATVRQAGITVLDGPDAAVRPGDPVEATVRFCNLGNTPARYALQWAATVVGQPATWPAWMDPGAAPVPTNTAALAPGACAEPGPTVPSLALRVPDRTPAGAANVRLVSVDSDAPVQSAAAFIPVEVAAVALPELTTLADIVPILPGQTKQLTVRIGNRGNIEGTFSLASAVVEASPANGWTLTPPASMSYTVAPGGVQVATFNVVAPNGGLPPGSGLTFRPRLEAAGVPQASLDLRALPPFPDLRVCPDTPGDGPVDLLACPPAGASTTTPTILFRDRPGLLNLRVSNLGAHPSAEPVTLRVEFRNEAGQPQGSVRRITIPALDYQAGAREHAVQVVVPTEGVQGTLRALATIDADGDVAEGDEADNVLDLALRVESFDIRITKPADLLVRPGEHISFSGPQAFQVENLGTRGYDLVLTTSLDPAWASFAPELVLGTGSAAGNGLPRGAARDVERTFAVPANPHSQSGNLTLRIAHTLAPEAFVEARVRLRIVDDQPPELSSVGANRTTVPDEGSVTFQVLITDATGVRAARLVVVEPGGAVRNVSMAPVAPGSDVHAASHRFTEAGPHRIHAWAKDRSTSGNAADTAATPITITVLPGAGPQIQRIHPTADVPVRPGTVLLYAIESTTPLRAVRYSSGGAATPLGLGNPVQIPTDGWADGPVNVTVTAEDTFGQVNTVVRSVVIDGTAPLILPLTMSPALPQAGQAVSFSVQVNDTSPLQTVTLRLQDLDGRVRDHAMLAVANATGRYNVTLTVPAGLELAQVVAEDVAGNRGFTESALATGGQKARDSPAAGPLLGLMLLAAALAGRRSIP